MRSPSRRYFSTEGIVVRARNLGEADRILVLLTPEHGLVSCVARGARKVTSKTGGHLDLLRHVSVSVTEGKSDLHLISQADTIDAYLGLRSDLDKLSLGCHMAEMCERFSAESAGNPALFKLLMDSLSYVRDNDSSALGLLRLWHEMELLKISGFQPELRRCVRTGLELPADDHWFSPAEGGVIMRQSMSMLRDMAKTTYGEPENDSSEFVVADSDPVLSSPVIVARMNVIKLMRYIATSGTWHRLSASRLKIGEPDIADALRLTDALLMHVQDRGPSRALRVINELT